MEGLVWIGQPSQLSGMIITGIGRFHWSAHIVTDTGLLPVPGETRDQRLSLTIPRDVPGFLILSPFKVLKP